MAAGIITAALLLLFVAGWIWAWLPSRREEFDAAARLPLMDDRPTDELVVEEKHS